MLSEYEAGQRTTQDGADNPGRITRTTSIAIAQAHGKYYDAIARGNCFYSSRQTAIALGTVLTATAVTLTLYNPPSTNKVMSLLRCNLAIPVATSAGQVVYAVNNTPGQAAPTTTTANAINNALIGGGSASVMNAFSAATLPAAPVAIAPVAGIISTTPGGVHSIIDDIDGSIGLFPGSMLTIQGITTNATGQPSFLWEEVPL